MVTESATHDRDTAPRWLMIAGVALLAVQALIFAANLATYDGTAPSGVIDIDGEANIAVWWSSTLLLAVAALAAVVYWLQRRAGRRAWHWALMGLGFAGLSLEEVASVHERVGDRLSVAPGNVSDWPLLYLPALLAGIVVIVRVARDLNRGQFVMMLAGAAAFSSVIASELVHMFGGASRAGIFFEEGAEVVGAVLILLALAWHVHGRIPGRAGSAATIDATSDPLLALEREVERHEAGQADAGAQDGLPQRRRRPRRDSPGEQQTDRPEGDQGPAKVPLSRP